MATQDNKNSIANNPFFNDYSTPHNTVPFHLIKLEHYEEAFMEGMKREKEELDKIINNEEEPTFDNTIIYKAVVHLLKQCSFFRSKLSMVLINMLNAFEKLHCFKRCTTALLEAVRY